MNETSDKVIDKIIDNATSRLRIPIVSTYIIVLLVHNWDLVYYLLFQTGQATTKIAYIKKHYPNYWGGIFEAIGIAICVLVVVSFLDLGLSRLLQWVYKEKKIINDKVNNYKTFEELNTSLSIQINEVVSLREHLTNEQEKNKGLLKNITTLTSEINDYKKTIDYNKKRSDDIKDETLFGGLMIDLFLLNEDKLYVFETFINVIKCLLKISEVKNNFYLVEFKNYDSYDDEVINENIIRLLIEYKYLDTVKDNEFEIFINKDKIKNLHNIFIS